MKFKRLALFVSVMVVLGTHVDSFGSKKAKAKKVLRLSKVLSKQIENIKGIIRLNDIGFYSGPVERDLKQLSSFGESILDLERQYKKAVKQAENNIQVLGVFFKVVNQMREAISVSALNTLSDLAVDEIKSKKELISQGGQKKALDLLKRAYKSRLDQIEWKTPDFDVEAASAMEITKKIETGLERLKSMTDDQSIREASRVLDKLINGLEKHGGGYLERYGKLHMKALLDIKKIKEKARENLKILTAALEKMSEDVDERMKTKKKDLLVGIDILEIVPNQHDKEYLDKSYNDARLVIVNAERYTQRDAFYDVLRKLTVVYIDKLSYMIKKGVKWLNRIGGEENISKVSGVLEKLLEGLDRYDMQKFSEFNNLYKIALDEAKERKKRTQRALQPFMELLDKISDIEALEKISDKNRLKEVHKLYQNAQNKLSTIKQYIPMDAVMEANRELSKRYIEADRKLLKIYDDRLKP